MTILYKISEKLYEAVIVKRPSKECRTPYVADIYIPELDINSLAHTPALGCCGLSDQGHKVLVKEQSTKGKVCKYVVMLLYIEEKGRKIYVGIHPKLSETIVNNALELNCFKKLQNVKEVEREKKYLNSRFDFKGKTKDDKEFILEVKSVPLSDYEDISAKDRKTKNYDDYDLFNKVAYFPDGYRKNKGSLVSPRALKHIEELEELTLTQGIETYLCYVIEREDANRFQTSILDPIYKEAVKKASDNGVNIITLQVRWNDKGEAEFLTDELELSL